MSSSSCGRNDFRLAPILFLTGQYDTVIKKYKKLIFFITKIFCSCIYTQYIYFCYTFIYQRVFGILYALDLKGNSRLGDFKKAYHGYARPGKWSSVMKKTAADSKTNGKKPDPHATYMVNSCQGKAAGVLF